MGFGFEPAKFGERPATAQKGTAPARLSGAVKLLFFQTGRLLGLFSFLVHFPEVADQPIGNHKAQNENHQPESYGQDCQKSQKPQILIKVKHFFSFSSNKDTLFFPKKANPRPKKPDLRTVPTK